MQNPIQTQFQTEHLLVNRMKPKLLNFHRKNLRALAVCFAAFIHVNSALCLFYHFGRLGYLVQLWDLEKFATLAAVYPSVSGTTIKHPGSATSRALSDNLHYYIPCANPQDTLWRNQILNGTNLRP